MISSPRINTLLIGSGLAAGLAFGLWRIAEPGGATGSYRASAAGTGDLARPLTSRQPVASNRGLPSQSAGFVLVAPPLRARLASGMESLQADTDSIQRAAKLQSFIQSISRADLPLALDFLVHQDASILTRDLKAALLRRWVRDDPQAAADWALGLPSGGADRQAAISDIAVVWAGQDLSAAGAWARQLPEGEDRNGGLLSVAYEAARTESLQALTIAMELPAGTPRDDLITHAASQWATQAPEAAAQWAKQIEDASLRDRVLAAVATAWGGSNPISAGTLAVDAISPGRQQDNAVVGIVQRWVQADPDQAAAWVLQFPEGPLRVTALQNLVQLWTDKSPDQVGIWLNGLEPGSGRDAAIGVYVTQLAPRAPITAAHWAEAITDESMRLGRLEGIGETWMAINASAARSWIPTTPLTETTKARLLAITAPAPAPAFGQ